MEEENGADKDVYCKALHLVTFSSDQYVSPFFSVCFFSLADHLVVNDLYPRIHQSYQTTKALCHQEEVWRTLCTNRSRVATKTTGSETIGFHCYLLLARYDLNVFLYKIQTSNSQYDPYRDRLFLRSFDFCGGDIADNEQRWRLIVLRSVPISVIVERDFEFI